MKKNFVRFVCLTLVMCIFLPLVACKKEDPSTDTNNNGDDNKKVVTTAKNSELIAYGNYFFYMSKKISRYNRKTGELTKACRDIECDGKKCPLECVYSTIAGVYDDKLYFFAYQNWKLNDKIFIGYQDILTGEVTALKTIDADLISMGSDQIYVDGGYVYYEATSLKEGGDKKNPNSYDDSAYVYRNYVN